jgi:hypothetical protein
VEKLTLHIVAIFINFVGPILWQNLTLYIGDALRVEHFYDKQ